MSLTEPRCIASTTRIEGSAVCCQPLTVQGSALRQHLQLHCGVACGGVAHQHDGYSRLCDCGRELNGRPRQLQEVVRQRQRRGVQYEALTISKSAPPDTYVNVRLRPNPVHAYSLVQVFRRLRAVGPNVSVPLTCLRREYVQGRCLLNVQAGTDFKVRTGNAVPPPRTRTRAAAAWLGTALGSSRACVVAGTAAYRYPYGRHPALARPWVPLPPPVTTPACYGAVAVSFSGPCAPVHHTPRACLWRICQSCNCSTSNSSSDHHHQTN